MKIVLTSLDGTLLDPQTNSYGAARQALLALERRSIPLILISYKSRAQIEVIRNQLHLEHPFIAEAGTALFVPEHYFPASIFDDSWQHSPPYYVQMLGLPYDQLRQILQAIRTQLQVDLVGLGDWTAPELAMTLGVSETEAQQIQDRSSSEIFNYSGDPERLRTALVEQERQFPGYQLYLQQLLSKSLAALEPKDPWYLTGGRRTAGESLRQATQLLLKCYQNHLGTLTALGIGSTSHDLGFLELVHECIVLPGPDYESLWLQAQANWQLAQLPGPEGWNEAVLAWLEEINSDD